MTPKEIKLLVKTLRSIGVEHYKDGEIEIHLGPKPLKPSKSEDTTDKPPIIDEMAQILRMDDEKLIDKLFPIPKEDANDGEIL